MNMSLVQMFAAIAMVGLAVALSIGYRKYLGANSERRMQTMLTFIGLDPALVTQGDTETIMKEARRRCRSCASEDMCERWLRKEEEGDNTFCPNSKMFEALRKHSGAAR